MTLSLREMTQSQTALYNLCAMRDVMGISHGLESNSDKIYDMKFDEVSIYVNFKP